MPPAARAYGLAMIRDDYIIRLIKQLGDFLARIICYRRAWEMLLEARLVEPHVDDDALIGELGRLVPYNQLDERYRS